MIKIDSDFRRAKKYADEGLNIVVVDVLRATSTIIVALSNNVKRIIPCETISEALEYKNKRNIILAGERGGIKITGFDHTNSPAEIAKVDLKNKTLILTTSSGTKLIKACVRAPSLLIGSTINAKAVAHTMSKIKGDWAVLGARSKNQFRPEDKVGCALISLYYLKFTGEKVTAPFRNFIKKYSHTPDFHIRNSLSAKQLSRIGYSTDVDFIIANRDRFSIVPTLYLNNKKKELFIADWRE